MADERPGARWQVADITETTRVTPSGRFEEVFQYTVETAWGGSFSVQIPKAIHSAEVAQSSIEAEFRELERGRFLSG